jgi:hypothetical protein
MATNFTTLALLAPAAKEISKADVVVAAEALLVAVLVGLVSMPAWVPVALTRVAPGPTQRGLAAVRDPPRSRVHRRAAQRRRAVLHRPGSYGCSADAAARRQQPPPGRPCGLAGWLSSAEPVAARGPLAGSR